MTNETAHTNNLFTWFFNDALPFWSQAGVDFSRGGFFERMMPDGSMTSEPRRARLVGRQIYSFASAVRLDWSGPGRSLVGHGLDWIERCHISADNTVIPLVSPEGLPLSNRFSLYDQAFVLFGLAAAAQIDERTASVTALAARLRDQMLSRYKHSVGGFEEELPRSVPLKANPHMHMLEACLAWSDVSGDVAWADLADEIVDLCLARFIDSRSGALHEYFDGNWDIIRHDGLDVVEPGHQAEWAWLLIRWGLARGRHDAVAAARRLLGVLERHGVSPEQDLAFNELNADLSIRDPLLRLWPQTERIKANIANFWIAEDAYEKIAIRGKIEQLVSRLFAYLKHPIVGAWWEHLGTDGNPVVESTRASSLYHLTCALCELHNLDVLTDNARKP